MMFLRTGDLRFEILSGLYFLFLFGANAVVLLPVGRDEGANLPFTASWIAMHVFTLSVFGLWIISRRIGFGLREYLLIAFSIYVGVSFTWSPEPMQSAPYSIMLAANAIFAYMASERIPPGRFLVLIRNVLIGMIAISLIAWIVGYPNVLYIDTHDRSNILGLQPIRGFFAHKILAAIYAVIAASIALYSSKGLPRIGMVTLCVLFVLMTGSSTGLLLMIIAFILFFVLNLFRGSRFPGAAAAILLVIVGLPAIILVSGYFEDILMMLGRDPTLTGRTELWSWGMDAFMQSPLVGWAPKGYFYSVHAQNSTVYQVLFRNYDVPHFHQSYIQTGVEFGIFGVLFLALNLGYVVFYSYGLGVVRGQAVGVTVLHLTLIVLVATSAMFVMYCYNHGVTVLMLYLLFSFARYRYNFQGDW